MSLHNPISHLSTLSPPFTTVSLSSNGEPGPYESRLETLHSPPSPRVVAPGIPFATALRRNSPDGNIGFPAAGCHLHTYILKDILESATRFFQHIGRGHRRRHEKRHRVSLPPNSK